MKRLAALLLCGALMLPLTTGAQGAQQQQAQEASGVSRGQAAQMLYEAQGSPAVTAGCPFSDVSEGQRDAVAWAAQQGIVAGVGEGCYAPERAVSGQEFCTMLWRLAGEEALPGGALFELEGAGDVAGWAGEAVNWALQTGVMQVEKEGVLTPTAALTHGLAQDMLRRAQSLPDLSGIREDLAALTAAQRPVGSRGEADAAAYLERRFSGMGYSVTRLPYTDEAGRTGSTVVAVKPAAQPGADILVLSAHHDSDPTAYGANDNASGVAALLYTAQALRELPTDTEIRFVSFTDEENGKKGSAAYLASLDEEERSRIVGDIQFDMLGGLGTLGTGLYTTDGQQNWLSGLLQGKDPALGLSAETASDHASFQMAGIPSVLLMQNGRGYLYHSAADTMQNLNLYAIAGAAETVLEAVREVADETTPSYRELAAQQGEGYTYRQTRQSKILFGSSREEVCAAIGATGELADSYEVTGNGWVDRYETYRYRMRWFDIETPICTDYHYRNGFLENVELRLQETGCTVEEVYEGMLAMYGAPYREEEGRVEWLDEVYGKYLTLNREEAAVTVSNYSVGITNVLASYPVQQGQAEIEDARDKAVWDYLCRILPVQARQKIAQFDLFTDGFGNILAYTTPLQEDGVTDNTRFCITVDYYDVYDEAGNPRDWSKLTYTILHEYGHVLLEDETQIDLSVGQNTHDVAGFVPGSFRMTFYETFWKELGDSAVADYEQNPTHYVSRYGANYFHEDIADTFAVFVLGQFPQGDTVAQDKLRFFFADENMAALRSAIRQNLGLS